VLAWILRMNGTALATIALLLVTHSEQIPEKSAHLAQLAGQARQRLSPGL